MEHHPLRAFERKRHGAGECSVVVGGVLVAVGVRLAREVHGGGIGGGDYRAGLVGGASEIRERLKPDTEIGKGEWVDISGLIAPKSEVDQLLDNIEKGIVNKLKEINGDFMRMHINYYTYEWTWAYEKMIEFFKLDPDTITASDIIRIVERWKDAVIGLDKMVYEDAKKEFSLSSMTGFGADGTKFEKEQDFEQVRGDFESNPFVTAVLDHIKVKTALGNELIERLKPLTVK